MLKKRKTEQTAEGDVIPVNGFTDNRADFEHEQDGEKEQGKVKNRSKKSKQVVYGSINFHSILMTMLSYKLKPVYILVI